MFLSYKLFYSSVAQLTRLIILLKLYCNSYCNSLNQCSSLKTLVHAYDIKLILFYDQIREGHYGTSVKITKKHLKLGIPDFHSLNCVVQKWIYLL